MGKSDKTEPPGSDPAGAGQEALSQLKAKSREVAKRLPVIGHVTWLCSQSASHKQMFIQDLEWRVFPPILLGQFKLQTDGKVGGLPTAFASWAYLSEEVEADYRRSQRLRAGDWRSGESLWLIDFVTPFGGAPRLLEELCYEVHMGREIKLLYPDDTGQARETTLSELRKRQTNEGSPGGSDGAIRH